MMGINYTFTEYEAFAILLVMALVIVGLALYVHKRHKNEKDNY